MSTPYYTLLTNIGLAKLLNAQALGTVVQWSHMAVGDGNGNPTAPTQAHWAHQSGAVLARNDPEAARRHLAAAFYKHGANRT